MPAQNGSTPLDVDNVQWKAGADSRSGDLTFNNGSPRITNIAGGMRLPVSIGHGWPSGIAGFYSIPRAFPDEKLTLRYPVPTLLEPLSRVFVPLAYSGIKNPNDMIPSTFTQGAPADNSYANVCACLLQVNPYTARFTTNSSPVNRFQSGGGLAASATTITMQNTPGTDWPASGFVRIENEFIKYAGISSNQLTGCTRGQFNTRDQAHGEYEAIELVLDVFTLEGYMLVSGF